MHLYAGWQKTWGGIMSGDPTERIQFHERAEHIMDAIPESSTMGDERAKDYWNAIKNLTILR